MIALLSVILAGVLRVGCDIWTLPDVWLVQFYQDKELKGPYQELQAKQLMFLNSIRLSPSLPETDFSTRYTSCLRLETSKKVDFEIGGDDGYRLFIDDRKVIENWHDHGNETSLATHTLMKGLHTIRVEHYQARGVASLYFKLRTDPNEPLRTSSPMLFFPKQRNGNDIQCE